MGSENCMHVLLIVVDLDTFCPTYRRTTNTIAIYSSGVDARIRMPSMCCYDNSLISLAPLVINTLPHTDMRPYICHWSQIKYGPYN